MCVQHGDYGRVTGGAFNNYPLAQAPHVVSVSWAEAELLPVPTETWCEMKSCTLCFLHGALLGQLPTNPASFTLTQTLRVAVNLYKRKPDPELLTPGKEHSENERARKGFSMTRKQRRRKEISRKLVSSFISLL